MVQLCSAQMFKWWTHGLMTTNDSIGESLCMLNSFDFLTNNQNTHAYGLGTPRKNPKHAYGKFCQFFLDATTHFTLKVIFTFFDEQNVFHLSEMTAHHTNFAIVGTNVVYFCF